MSTQLVSMDTRYGFTPEQVDVIKATIALGATNEELALFLMVCQKTELDPFSRQIYLSERWSNGVSKKTPETTIDGFRVIAERSGKYAGQLGPFWCGTDGEWKDVWLSLDSMPSAAKVGILRTDFKEPVWGIALFEEYKQTKKDGSLNSMWTKMGANQLAKCAESLGLRKAFPRDLSGMYSREEMAQADKESAKEIRDEVVERRLAEERAKVTPDNSYQERHNATIVELADFLDVPPGMPIEEAVEAKAKPKVSKRKKGTIPFKELPRFEAMKLELRKLVGDDSMYYDCLKLALVNHADELNTENYVKVFKLMGETYRKFRGDKRRMQLAGYEARLGGRYLEILGENGFENTDMLVTEAKDQQMQAVLDDLKVYSEAK